MSKVTDTAREKSRALRYARAAVEELELELMCGAIYDIQEQCDEIAYYTQDEETLMNALDGDEGAAHEFKLMFSELAGECERLCETLDDIYVTDCFDDFFVGIMKGGKSPMRMIGYDAYECDWHTLCGYDEHLATNASYKRLMKLTKDELIHTAGQCFGVAASYLSVKSKYEQLRAAFDILLDKNTGYLQTLKDIDKAYEELSNDWNSIKAEREFDRLTAGLPDKAWIE